MKRTLDPLSATVRITRITRSASAPVRYEVGSSRIRMCRCAWLDSSRVARTMATLARSAGARSPTRAPGSTSTPNLSRSSTLLVRSRRQRTGRNPDEAYPEETPRFSMTVISSTSARSWWMTAIPSSPGLLTGNDSDRPNTSPVAPLSGVW